MGIFTKIFGTHSDHELKRIRPIVDRIESLRPEMQALSDEELKAKTPYFKERLTIFCRKPTRSAARRPEGRWGWSISGSS